MVERAAVDVDVYTNHFMGSIEKGRELLRLLETVDGGRWLPQKWNIVEPVRHPYVPEAHERILTAWSGARPASSRQVTNELLFQRTRPRLLFKARAWRSVRPWLNDIWARFDGRAFQGDDGPERLCQIVLAFVSWSDAVFATAFHSAQAHGRGGPGTPLVGLRRLDWLTYWGASYVEEIGRARLLHVPCHRVEPCGPGVLLQATPRFDSPPLLASDTLLLSLERYLGADLFAGSDYPRVPCRVPAFDMSETVCEVAPVSTRPRRRASRAEADPSQLPALLSALASEAEATAAAKGVALDYSPASVGAVDALLEELRRTLGELGRTASKTARRQLASAFGAYVGEVFRRHRGGAWEYEEPTRAGLPPVALQCDDLRVFPIDKVYKRLTRGAAESLDLYVAAVLLRPSRSVNRTGNLGE